MTTQDFLKSLSGMQVAKFDDNTIYMANGMEVRHYIKLNEWLNFDSFGRPDGMPMQMQLIVLFNGAQVMTWGAETELDNAQLVRWWMQHRVMARNKSKEVERGLAKVGYTLLMQGID
jgi:hypothetical protein